MKSNFGEFHKEKINGKPYLIFHGPTIDSINNQTHFICPGERIKSAETLYMNNEDLKVWDLTCFPLLQDTVLHQNKSLNQDSQRLDFVNHHILPLFWCNTKDTGSYGDCGACSSTKEISSGYYFCVDCDRKYHKECVELSFEIKHPYHPKHPLKLCFTRSFKDCIFCEKIGPKMVYHCTQCNLGMHPICVRRSISFVLEKPKRHEHPLTFFTRNTCLHCNVCGLTNETHPTYICLECNFVAHKDCAYFPTVIRISRHYHRISFTDSLPPEQRSCGVCRKNVDREYGGYTCNKCDGYIVHSRCALRRDIWDGIELEGVPEEDDIEKVTDDSFKRISEGIILHFSHDHYLRFEISKVYDDNKICQGCVLPIYEGGFYSCIECDFILHDKCANASRRIRHPLHPHPLTLKVTSEYNTLVYNDDNYFLCFVCARRSCGFIYMCDKKTCCFQIDMRCGFIYEPFEYQGHEHPLYLALDPKENRNCQMCKKAIGRTLLNCIECDFIICFYCVTLPYMVRYKHDDHFLVLGFKEEGSEIDWCEICEGKLPSRNENERFYTCDLCCTSLHVGCLLGNDLYLKHGRTMKLNTCSQVQFLRNNLVSRPICDQCHRRCGNKIYFKVHNKTCCCLEHANLLDAKKLKEDV